MADDKAKKTKIDLKARLGKTQVGGANAPSAVPLPMPGSAPLAGPPSDSQIPGPPSSGDAPPPSSPVGQVSPAPVVVPAPRPSRPIGIAPPPGLSPGIPLPPFGPRPVQQQAAPKPTAAQQTIKVEIGEEIEQERKKARRMMGITALLSAVVALAIGWVAGGSQSAGNRVALAQAGAAALEKDVKVAHDKMEELDKKLTDASASFGDKKFPDDLAVALGGLNVPFEPANLENKQVGSLPPKVLKALLTFTAAAQDVNKKKDSLKNVLGQFQSQIVKAWKEEKEPVANFSVLFTNAGGKAFAELVSNKEPFPWKGAFADSYTVIKKDNNRPSDKKVSRWTKGDILPSGGDAVALPVDPQTVAAFTNDAQIFAAVQKALLDNRTALEGDASNPAAEITGAIKLADNLANDLHTVATAR